MVFCCQEFFNATVTIKKGTVPAIWYLSNVRTYGTSANSYRDNDLAGWLAATTPGQSIPSTLTVINSKPAPVPVVQVNFTDMSALRGSGNVEVEMGVVGTTPPTTAYFQWRYAGSAILTEDERKTAGYRNDNTRFGIAVIIDQFNNGRVKIPIPALLGRTQLSETFTGKWCLSALVVQDGLHNAISTTQVCLCAYIVLSSCCVCATLRIPAMRLTDKTCL